jgi:hypothetical protein
MKSVTEEQKPLVQERSDEEKLMFDSDVGGSQRRIVIAILYACKRSVRDNF